MRTSIFAAIICLLPGMSFAQAADDAGAVQSIQAMSAYKVSRLDFGITRAESLLYRIIRDHQDKQLGDSSPYFHTASVVWDPDVSTLYLIAYFSEYYERKITRGNCADALEYFRTAVFVKGQAENGDPNLLAKNIFAPSAGEEEYVNVATQISVAASIGHRDWKQVKLGCASDLTGNDVTFDKI